VAYNFGGAETRSQWSGAYLGRHGFAAHDGGGLGGCAGRAQLRPEVEGTEDGVGARPCRKSMARTPIATFSFENLLALRVRTSDPRAKRRQHTEQRTLAPAEPVARDGVDFRTKKRRAQTLLLC